MNNQERNRASRYNYVINGGQIYQHIDDIKPRGFTAEDVDDAMVERALRVNWDLNASTVHRMLTAALTVPTRPEGAEDIEKILGSWHLSDALGKHFTADALDSLADHLAAHLTDPTAKNG